jgi:hypothetical protein
MIEGNHIGKDARNIAAKLRYWQGSKFADWSLGALHDWDLIEQGQPATLCRKECRHGEMMATAGDLIVLDTSASSTHTATGCSVVASSVRELRQALTPNNPRRNSSGWFGVTNSSTYFLGGGNPMFSIEEHFLPMILKLPKLLRKAHCATSLPLARETCLMRSVS